MSTKDFPRLAIIGCGAVVEHHLLPALLRLGWKPRVLVDRSLDRASRLAKRVGSGARAPVTATEWEPNVGQFDAALIATPHALHGPIGLALLPLGVHVFMEKPLATTPSECRQLVAASRDAGAVLAVGHMRRHLHMAKWLKALIESGTLGEIESFEAREGSVYNWAVSSGAPWHRELAGGGTLMDIGVHTIDLLLWWLGEADVVDYHDDSYGGVEADCVAKLAMKSGAEGVVELSRTRHLSNTIRIVGSNGHVEAHFYDNKVISASADVWDFEHGCTPQKMPQQLFTELFGAEFHDFLDSIRTKRRPAVDGAEATRSVELIDRCYTRRRALGLPWVQVLTGAALPSIGNPRSFPSITPETTCVVTGGTGFIGGRLVERLIIDQKAKVRCIVRNLAQAARIARFPVDIIAADLLDKEALDRTIAGTDIVFHCAYDPKSRKQNMDGIRNLIEACLKHKVRRLVHLSTVSVYEPLPDGNVTEQTPDGDTSWSYTLNKLDLERELLSAARDRGLRATVLQPTIVYGPFSKYWTDAQVEMLLSGTVVLPAGGGLCNCVYVDDVVEAMMLVVERDEGVGERVLISGPQTTSWAEFYAYFERALGVEAVQFQPAERIAKSTKSVSRDVKMVFDDPRRIVRIIVRWNLARRALQSLLDSLPRELRQFAIKHYFRERKRKLGEAHLPDKQLLDLYNAKAVVSIEKARRLLGYEPRFAISAGMELTRRYIVWAFADRFRTQHLSFTPPRNETCRSAAVEVPRDVTSSGRQSVRI
jgi:predicted dehydrogenase/nucleoside-diphosphate-sugar epimerase